MVNTPLLVFTSLALLIFYQMALAIKDQINYDRRFTNKGRQKMNKNISNLMVKDIIKDLDLKVGQEQRMACPKCREPNCFGIKKGNRVYVYNCFRVSCKFHGSFKYVPSVKDLKERLMQSSILPSDDKEVIVLPPFEDKEFTIPERLQFGICSPKALVWLKSNQAFEAYENGFFEVYTDLKENRLVFPLKDINGKLTNMGGRALQKKDNPKFRLYSKNKVPPFVCGLGESAVIVEDVASAASVSRIPGLVGFALLGTTFQADEHLPWLRDFKTIYVSLDPDATRISMDIQKLLSCTSLAEVRILFSKRDYKHYTKDELIEFMEKSNVIKKEVVKPLTTTNVKCFP